MKNISKSRLFLQTVQSFFTTWALMKIGRMEPGNILTLVFFLLVFLFYRYTDDRLSRSVSDSKSGIYRASFLLSLLFSVLYIAIDYPYYIDKLTNTLFRIGMLTAVFLGLQILFYYLLIFLFLFTTDQALLNQLIFTDNHGWSSGSGMIPFHNQRLSGISGTIYFFYLKHTGLCTFLLCMLCWLPYLLYQYPGIMTPDSLVQFEQVLGITPYSNHHPWVHTLLIKLLYTIGFKLTGSMLAALSFYTIFQMGFLSWSISFFINTLKQYRIKPGICFLFTLFYALVPYHAVYSVTLWKDIPFAAAVLCFGCAALRFNLGISAADFCVYIISGLMLCLFRSNGWYAFVLCLPFLLLYFRKKCKFVPLALLGIFISAVIIKYPVMNAFSVTQPDLIESLSIPAQQITAVLCNDRNLKEEDLAMIENVVDLTYIKELYNPYFADNIKELVRAGNQSYLEEHKWEFLKLWGRLGLRYPDDYLTAYIHQTHGYWFPDSFYPVADAEGVSATSLGVSHTPLIRGPLVVKGKEIAIKLGSMIPLYGTLWSMGIISWVFLFCLANALIRKERAKLILYLPSAALLLTVLIATPVATDFRYVYFMVLSLPFYLITALMPMTPSAAVSNRA